MSSSSQEEIAVNLPMIRKMERICRFLSQIQKKLSQIQTFFCHRFKHFCQHRSNHALDFHFLLLSLYDWPNLANKKSGECGDFWPSRSFVVFCFLNEQWSENLEIICRSYLLPSDQFVSFHFHFLNRKMFMYLSKNVWSVLRLHFCLLLLWTKMIKKGSAVGRPLVWRPALLQIYIFHIYTRPKFTQFPDIHGTHIYTAQIYTNPFSHIDSKKPKFTQNPYLHNTTLHKTQIYRRLFLQILHQTISSEFHYQPWLVQKILKITI